MQPYVLRGGFDVFFHCLFVLIECVVQLDRQIAMYLCRDIIGLPLKTIGTIMGKKDHTTVIHACNTITADMEKSESTRNTIEIIKKKITPN